MTDVQIRGECQVLDNEILQSCFQPIWLFEDKQSLTNWLSIWQFDMRLSHTDKKRASEQIQFVEQQRNLDKGN